MDLATYRTDGRHRVGGRRMEHQQLIWVPRAPAGLVLVTTADGGWDWRWLPLVVVPITSSDQMGCRIGTSGDSYWRRQYQLLLLYLYLAR